MPRAPAPIPQKEDMQKFLKVFDALSLFESHCRIARGYGAFSQNEVPCESTVRVVEWMRRAAV